MQADQDQHIDYKLTGSYYPSSDGNDARDINLRASFSAGNAWVGNYRDRDGFEVSRVGFDTTFDFRYGRVNLSPEFGSTGYASGWVGTELGGDTFAILGLSRTNMRDFYNLNFDPGDAVTVGIGTRALAGTDLSLYQVRDDRLETGQRVTHLTWRYRPTDDQRITIAAVHKHGPVDDERTINAYGLTVGYDYKRVFLRIGRDPYANFGTAHVNRFSAGLRF